MQANTKYDNVFHVSISTCLLNRSSDSVDLLMTVNQAMSRRVIYKAVLEALALIGCSVAQVVLLRRLFEKKLGQSRV